MTSIETGHPMASPATGAPDSQNPSSLALCGARTRQGGECRHVAMRNGRCRFHGGLSTGPRTSEGLARSRTSTLVHGGRSQATRDFRRMVRELQAEARHIIELV